jgi:gamma-glutamyltranspeptidase/glutathione hydrolase
MTPRAAVATSQPLATEAGVSVLRAGGTAADAAVAVAAALQVTKPCATGLGGDAFFLYFDAATQTVSAYNGSGRSPAALTPELARSVAVDGFLPDYHPLTVTVPGALDTWLALHERFGTLPMGRLLESAIRLAADGFPVAPMTARWWESGAERQLSKHEHGAELMVHGRGPRAGEVFCNPGLAAVLESIATDGRNAFYSGWIAQRIVDAVAAAGGVLALSDLHGHAGEWTDPIGIDYRGVTVHECPPNGQGLAALIALGIYRELDAATETERLHAKVEAMRLAFADAARHVADPAIAPAPVDELLSAGYLRDRAGLIDMGRRMDKAGPGLAGSAGSDTVYFSVVDEQGNGCSFINSNFMGFGTGIVPRGCGFSLQNRGRGFVLDEGHANALAPGKRPYHTIIPGLMTDTESGDLAAVFGIMGGMMQPQAHLQVVSMLIDDGLDPQAALDAPRFQLENGAPDGTLLVEDSMDSGIVSDLERRGHDVEIVDGSRRSLFGLGQVIAPVGGALWSGSDPRGDGHAAGY